MRLECNFTVHQERKTLDCYYLLRGQQHFCLFLQLSLGDLLTSDFPTKNPLDVSIFQIFHSQMTLGENDLQTKAIDVMVGQPLFWSFSTSWSHWDRKLTNCKNGRKFVPSIIFCFIRFLMADTITLGLEWYQQTGDSSKRSPRGRRQPPGVLDGSDNAICLHGSLRQEVFITVAYF